MARVFVNNNPAKPAKQLKEGDIITWHIYGDDTYYESKIVGIDRDPQNQNIKISCSGVGDLAQW